MVGRRENHDDVTRGELARQILIAVAVAPNMCKSGECSAGHMYYIIVTCSSTVRMAPESSTAVCSWPPAVGALSMPSQEFMLQCR